MTDTTATQQIADNSTTEPKTDPNITADPKVDLKANEPNATKIDPAAKADSKVDTKVDPDPKTDPKDQADKWREDYAAKVAMIDGKLDQKQHDKILARLTRFPSMKEALDWAFNADKKISDGSYKKPPDAKATAEQIAEYRKANGIPDDPAAYFEKLPNGLVIGDEDKPIYDELAKHLHAKHAPPEIIHGIVEWYEGFKDQQEGLRHDANMAAKTATEDAMREEWGPDYRANNNLVKNFIGTMPQDLQDELFTSTTADGKQVMNNPKMMSWLAQQARDLGFNTSVLPSGETNAKDMATEIAELEKLSGNKNSTYWKGAKHPTMKGETIQSARLLELYSARDRQSKRKAG